MSNILTSRLIPAAVVEEAKATSLQKLDGVLSELNAFNYSRSNPDARGVATHAFRLSNGANILVEVDENDEWEVFVPISTTNSVQATLDALRVYGGRDVAPPEFASASSARPTRWGGAATHPPT